MYNKKERHEEYLKKKMVGEGRIPPRSHSSFSRMGRTAIHFNSAVSETFCFNISQSWYFPLPFLGHCYSSLFSSCMPSAPRCAHNTRLSTHLRSCFVEFWIQVNCFFFLFVLFTDIFFPAISRFSVDGVKITRTLQLPHLFLPFLFRERQLENLNFTRLSSIRFVSLFFFFMKKSNTISEVPTIIARYITSKQAPASRCKMNDSQMDFPMWYHCLRTATRSVEVYCRCTDLQNSQV